MTSDRPGATLGTRVLAGSALAGVSVIAGIVSYLHGVAVVRSVGEGRPLDYLIPFLADLVILGASASLLATARGGERLPRLTIAALAVAIGVTLAVNVAAGWHHGWGGRLVAGWPALAFLLALHSLAGVVRRDRDGDAPGAAPAAPGQPAAVSLDEAIRAARPHMSERATATAFEVSRARVAKALAGPAPSDPAAADSPAASAWAAPPRPATYASANGAGRPAGR